MDQVGILLGYIIIDTAYCCCSTPPTLNIKRITHIWDAALFLADVSKWSRFISTNEADVSKWSRLHFNTVSKWSRLYFDTETDVSKWSRLHFNTVSKWSRLHFAFVRLISRLSEIAHRICQTTHELAFINVAIYRFTSADRLSGCFNVGTRVKQAWLRTWDPSVELGRLPHRPYCPLSCFQWCYPLRCNSQRQLCEWQRRMSKQHYMLQTCKYFL